MKAPFKFFALLSVVSFFSVIGVRAQDDAPPPPPPDQAGPGDQGDQGTSFQTFYDQLGDQGTWVQTDDYGYVFQPNVSDPDWAPYTDGHWVYTDVGWTWVSDEPWGWATYHYGRWANIDGMSAGSGFPVIAMGPGVGELALRQRLLRAGLLCRPKAWWAPNMVRARRRPDCESIFTYGGDVDVDFHIGRGLLQFCAC